MPNLVKSCRYAWRQLGNHIESLGLMQSKQSAEVGLGSDAMQERVDWVHPNSTTCWTPNAKSWQMSPAVDPPSQLAAVVFWLGQETPMKNPLPVLVVSCCICIWCFFGPLLIPWWLVGNISRDQRDQLSVFVAMFLLQAVEVVEATHQLVEAIDRGEDWETEGTGGGAVHRGPVVDRRRPQIFCAGQRRALSCAAVANFRGTSGPRSKQIGFGQVLEILKHEQNEQNE